MPHLAVFVLFMVVSRSSAEEVVETPVNDGMRVSSQDWPWWRGPHRDGTADPHQSPPTQWSENENVLWKVRIPGRGHGSPTVVGDRIYLATADQVRGHQSLLCFDRDSGRPLWESIVHRGGLMHKNEKSSQASPTAAWDGERLVVSLLNDGAVYATAVGPDSRQLWQTKVSDYVLHQGYAASPAIYQGLVIIAADNKGGGTIAALDRKSGDIVWRRDRPRMPNYSSPVILHVQGQDQLILTGCEQVVSYAPLTGEINWKIAGATTECVTTTVTNGELVYSSGGYPDNHVAAIRGNSDGTATEVWRNSSRVYVPSMVFKQGYLYAVLDAGVATCWEAATGKEMWKARLGGTFSGSAVLVGDLVYVTNEEGTTFLFAATPSQFRLIRKNQLGDSIFATPTICGGHIYMRLAHQEDQNRQEWLYCLAQ